MTTVLHAGAGFGLAGFKGDLPEIQFAIVMPDILMDSARMQREHNKIARASMKTVLLIHHRTRMPLHFRQDARHRYQHKERTPAYKAIKRAEHHKTTDLVKTGQTKSRFSVIRPKITVTGSAATEAGIKGRAYYDWPFPTTRDNHPSKVTIEQMGKEFATFTANEMFEVAEQFRDEYVGRLVLMLATRPRQKQIYGRKLSKLVLGL